MSLTPIKYVNDVGIKELGKIIPKVWIGTKEQYEQLDKTTLADNTIVNIIDDYEEYPIQVKEMPIPKEENQIVQYIGQTTSDYTNGFFYKCMQEENNLIWKNISVSNTYKPSNEEVLDKFSENDEGKVLYDNKPLASDNLWHGTQAEYDALGEYDENKTYVITDGGEEADLSEVVIDDTSTTATNKTYSVAKIINLLTNWQTVTLNETVSDVTVKKLKIGNVIFMHTHINGLSYTGYGGMGDTLFSTSDPEIIKPTASITDVVRSIIDVDDKNSNPMKRIPADIDFHLKTGEFKLYCMGESTQQLTNVNLYGDIFSIIYP